MPNITANTDEIVSSGGTINALSGQIEDLITQLKSTAESMAGSWTGPAASAFQSAMQEWNTAAVAIQTAASDMGRATQASGNNYSDADTTNKSMFS